MRLSTSTNIVAFVGETGRNPFEFCIKICAQAGYKVLDINLCEMMNPHSRLRGDDWEDYARELMALGVAYGVTFPQCHLPYYDVFGERDQGKAALMEKLIHRAILVAGMLGVRWAVTHPATLYSAGNDAAAHLQANLTYYAPHISLARACGLGIALENDFEYKAPPYQRIYCAAIPELIQLADAFGDPKHVGVCYDFGHAHLTGGFHRQNLNLIGSRLVATHVQDNHGLSDEHLMPFFGTINWAEAMAGLSDIGYAGDLTYEIQRFGQFLPTEHKHLVVTQSLEIGRILLGLYEGARQRQA